MLFTLLREKLNKYAKLTFVLTDVMLIVGPDVFVETRLSVFSTNTRTPVVVSVIVEG